MKSKFTLLAVLCLFLISLVGCNHDNPASASNTNPPKQTPKDKKMGGAMDSMNTQ